MYSIPPRLFEGTGDDGLVSTPWPATEMDSAVAVSAVSPIAKDIGRSLAGRLYEAVASSNVGAIGAAISSGQCGISDKFFLAAANGVYKVPDRRGSATLLHLAASLGKTDVCKWLVSHGADVSATDAHGHTALEVAKDGPVKLLLSRAALAAVARSSTKYAPTAATIMHSRSTTPVPPQPGAGVRFADDASPALVAAVSDLDLEALGYGPM